jgi:hypothetical protein
MNLKDFVSFLLKYKTLSKEDMTHTIFSNTCMSGMPNIFKVCIPFNTLPLFWTKYLECLNENPLNKDNICITERSRETLQYFLDVDLNESILENNLDCLESSEFLVDVLDKVINSSDKIVNEYYKNDNDEYTRIDSFRSLYKCHIYYKGLYINANDAKNLSKNLNELLSTEYSWWDKKYIDSSVYSSGLRMLGCSKFGLSKTPESNSESNSYRIGELDKEYFVIRYKDLCWEYLVDTSTIVDTTNVSCIEPLKNIPQPNNLKRNESSNDSLSGSTTFVFKRPRVEDQIEFDQDFVSNLYKHLVSEKTGITLPSESDFKIEPLSNDCVRIDLPCQECPFVNKKHKRTEERNVSAHYILLTAFDMNFRCWKCPEIKSINTPNDSVMDVLENNSDNFLLKNSLYKQTHETIADFIFSIVKFDNATSLSKQNYIWYYYNKELHRWNRGEKITSLIMNVKVFFNVS